MKSATLSRPRPLVHLALVALVASLLSVVGATPVLAAVIDVETFEDGTVADGDCTLREAIENANADGQPNADCDTGAGADTIALDDGTYEVTDGELEVTDSAGLTITGQGADETTIDGDGDGAITCVAAGAAEDRIFHVTGGGALTLRELTVQHGEVSENTGGADALGGGIYTEGTGALTLELVEVRDNFVCTNNAAGEALGGGIAHTSSGTLTITQSTIAGNDAATNGGTARGGGIYLDGPANVVNSTISTNTAVEGGGIYVDDDGDLSLTYVTIYNNDQDGVTGAAGSVVSFQATIVADNPDDGDDCSGDIAGFTTEGDNLSSQTGCGFGADDQESDDPELNSLDDNGGTTRSHEPDEDSPAVDAISDSDCDDFGNANGEDQRDQERPSDDDDDCDIGAVELTENEKDDVGSGGGSSTSDDELDATPETATSALPGDTSHTVTVYFDEDELDIDDEDEVDFKIISGPNVRGDSDEPDFACNLSSDRCSITYTSNGEAGTDVICAWLDTDDDNNYSRTSSATDGGSCDTESLSPTSSVDNDFTDVVQSTWTVPTTTTTTTMTTTSTTSSTTTSSPRTIRVSTFVTLGFRKRAGAFEGNVSSARRRCLRRIVTVKRVDAGPNTVVGSAESGREGHFRLLVFGRPRGRFYAVAARKVFTTSSGNTVICRSGRSDGLRL